MITFEKCLALVFSLMILGQAYLVRRYVGTWLFPACLFGLFWFGFTFFPLTILFWIPVNWLSIGFILLCTTAFSSTALLFDWKTAMKRNLQKPAPATYGSEFLWKVFLLCASLAVFFLLVDWYNQGFSFADLLLRLQDSAIAYASIIYSENIVLPDFVQYGLVSCYLASAIGGILFEASEKKRRWKIVVLSFAPAFFVALAETSKGLMFLSLAFFCAGHWVYRICSGRPILLERQLLRRAIPILLVLCLIFAFAITMRSSQSEDTKENAELIASYAASYCCGHLYAYSDWFSSVTRSARSDTTYEPSHFPIGFYTFMAPYNIAGYHPKMPMGIFDDSYSNGPLISNVYTVFRELLMDFGFFGTLLFMFLSGLMLHYAFYQMLSKPFPAFTSTLYIFMIAAFYNSFLFSLLASKRFYLAFVLLWLVMQVNKNRSSSPGGWAQLRQAPNTDVRISRSFSGERAV